MAANPRMVAYILKGYPRISETFILNEIDLLESMGLKLYIFAVKQEKEKKRHAVVEKIQAPVTYLPEDQRVVDKTFALWLWHNLPRFASSHLRLLWRRPKAYLQTLFYVLFGLSFTITFGVWPQFKRTFLKDFFRAGYIALHVLNNHQIQHLHGHFCHGSTTITMLTSYLTGIPFSFTAHAKDIYLPSLNPRGLLQTKLQEAEFVATCTDANRQYLQQLWPHGTPIYTIYHGLDTARFAPTAEPTLAPVSSDRPQILAVGRFVEKKGFPYLVQACRLLKDRGLDFTCRIIGQRDEQSELVDRLIDQLDLTETVKIEGGMNQDELRQAYSACTIFALPCYIVDNGDRDGIPNVLAEAMAMGKPVVSTNISGIPELVQPGVNGLLVPQKDATALADALAQLLNDVALRQRLGNAARATICACFDATQTTTTLKQLFDEALQARVANQEGKAQRLERSRKGLQALEAAEA